MNVLNINAANFGNDIGKRFLGDVLVSVRLHGDTSGLFRSIGYTNPEKAFKVNKEYAEFQTGMPIVTAAMDCKSAKYTFSSKIKQFQAETFGLALGAEIDYTDVATPRVILGSSMPSALECSIILSGQTKDGKDLDVYIRKAIVTGETVEIMLGATEYGELPFDCIVGIDDNPLETNWSWYCKGSISKTVATLSAGTTMTVNTSTSLVVGMKAFTEDSGYLGLITDITGSVVTLDTAWTETGTGVAVKFVSLTEEAKNNIGFFEFAA